jgi:hypothetical protein
MISAPALASATRSFVWGPGFQRQHSTHAQRYLDRQAGLYARIPAEFRIVFICLVISFLLCPKTNAKRWKTKVRQGLKSSNLFELDCPEERITFPHNAQNDPYRIIRWVVSEF